MTMFTGLTCTLGYCNCQITRIYPPKILMQHVHSLRTRLCFCYVGQVHMAAILNILNSWRMPWWHQLDLWSIGIKKTKLEEIHSGGVSTEYPLAAANFVAIFSILAAILIIMAAILENVHVSGQTCTLDYCNCKITRIYHQKIPMQHVH